MDLNRRSFLLTLGALPVATAIPLTAIPITPTVAEIEEWYEIGGGVFINPLGKIIKCTQKIKVPKLYSLIADWGDDFMAMGYENPMLPITRNHVTLENGYTIANKDFKFITEGAIEDGDDLWTSHVDIGQVQCPHCYGSVDLPDFDPTKDRYENGL